MQKTFFISGLPRAGSTLLAALLQQNPACVAGMSSPVFSLVNGMIPRLSNANEFNSFIDDATRERILRGIFTSYYADHADKVVFDTNRHWTARLPLLLRLFPETRFICLVRPLDEIVHSFDALFARNPLQLSRLVQFDPDTTVYSRCDALMAGNGLIGAPLNGLKEAFYGPDSDRLMLISYRNLAIYPADVLAAIYNFLGLAPHSHNFSGLSFDATEYDAGMGLAGLHDVRAKVSYQPADITLPPDLLARLAGPYFWEDSAQPSDAEMAWSVRK